MKGPAARAKAESSRKGATISIPMNERVFGLAFNDQSSSELDMGLLALGLRTRVVVLHLRPEEEEGHSGGVTNLSWHVLREINHDGRIQCLSWSPLSSLLENRLIFATGNSKEVQLFGLSETGEEVSALIGHSDYVNALAFQPESGEQLASGSDDASLIMWNAQNGQRNHVFTLASPVMSVVWNRADPSKIMAAQKNGQIHVFNAITYNPILSFDAGPGPLTTADWSVRNPSLVAAAVRSQIVVWNLSRTSTPIFKKVLHEGGVRHLKFSHRQDNVLASAGQPNYTVMVSNIRSATVIHSSDSEPVGGLDWHPAFNYLAVGKDEKVTLERIHCKS